MQACDWLTRDQISKNYDDWTSTELNAPETITLEPVPTSTTKKRGVIALNDEVMKEAKKCLKEKGIRAEDVKNLPPIEELCKPIPHSSTIEVHSLQHFDEGDIPYGKPPDQLLEELDILLLSKVILINKFRIIYWKTLELLKS